MIEYQCPHCQRVLKVPETFIGVEGACNYCGTRLTIQADVVASTVEPAEGAVQQAQDAAATQTRQTVERLAKDLEKERIARLEAEAAREVAEERIRHLERKAAAAIAQWTDHAALQADFDLAKTQLAQSQQEVGRLHKELEAARGVTHREVSQAPRVNAIRPPVRTVSRGRQIVSVCILIIVVTILVAISLWRPSTESLRSSIQPAIDMVRDKLSPQAAPAPATPTGAIDATACYVVSRPQSAPLDIPAPGIDVAIISVRQDESLAPPAEWLTGTTDKDGHVALKDLASGHYLVRQAPQGPRADWKPLDSSAGSSPDVVTVPSADTAKFTLHVEDTVSTIHGQVVDAETAKPVAKAPIELTGEASAGQKIALASSDDGAFVVDSKELGYGAFKVECSALPKGYASATDFTGNREPGVKLDPITIRLSKKPAAHK